MSGASRKFELGSPLHMIEAAYLAVASIGLLHGLEPGQSRFKKHEHLIPKVSGLILLLTAATFFLGLR